MDGSRPEPDGDFPDAGRAENESTPELDKDAAINVIAWGIGIVFLIIVTIIILGFAFRFISWVWEPLL